VKSFIISVRSSPGYNPANVLVAQLALPKDRSTQRTRNFEISANEVLSRYSRPAWELLPRAWRVMSHLAASARASKFQVVGKPLQPGERQGAPFTAVSADYFSTMQIGLVKGRLFSIPPTRMELLLPIIISQNYGPEQLLSGEDPIGKKLRLGEQHSVGTIVWHSE